jgi:hypothetical protein
MLYLSFQLPFEISEEKLYLLSGRIQIWKMSTSGVLCRHSSVRTAHGAADDVMSDPMNDEEISHSIIARRRKFIYIQVKAKLLRHKSARNDGEKSRGQ